ncbi:MAG TPA: zinc ribbon domain-containing protein [Solirubrobacterales bacterium]|nr:zinc ribbon domain-containing protein [Solirubrobacterales bacterium]
MDLRLERLNSGEQLAAGSAIALFACMFFSWFNFGFDTTNAWESLHYISPILTVVIVATLGIAFMKAAGKSLGDIPDGSAIFALGCLAALLILYRLIDPVSLPGAEGFEPSGSVQAGLFLALLSAAGIAAGGYIATGGTALDRIKARIPKSPAPAAPPPTVASTPAPPPPAPASPANTGGSFCEECGTAIGPNDRFCSGCGREQAPSAG